MNVSHSSTTSSKKETAWVAETRARRHRRGSFIVIQGCYLLVSAEYGLCVTLVKLSPKKELQVPGILYLKKNKENVKTSLVLL